MRNWICKRQPVRKVGLKPDLQPNGYSRFIMPINYFKYSVFEHELYGTKGAINHAPTTVVGVLFIEPHLGGSDPLKHSPLQRL